MGPNPVTGTLIKRAFGQTHTQGRHCVRTEAEIG